ncbi:protein of unknown function [Moritella yayanosii]|uniref:Uncharacterized protein n=1 Tax=Moritella yayanosii TaxID=69539 RepID=A0A330LMI4_9GAMM|nr:protein of unknown function [Moritella yayanosii]
MKRLIRTDSPTCLNSFKHGRDKWDELLQDGLDSCIAKEFQTALEHIWHYNQQH